MYLLSGQPVKPSSSTGAHGCAGEGKTLDVLLKANGGKWSATPLTRLRATKRSSRDASLVQLKARGLVEFAGRGTVRTSGELDEIRSATCDEQRCPDERSVGHVLRPAVTPRPINSNTFAAPKTAVLTRGGQSAPSPRNAPVFSV